MCVRELCVTKLVGRRAGGGWGVHNNKQEPHTKMWEGHVLRMDTYASTTDI